MNIFKKLLLVSGLTCAGAGATIAAPGYSWIPVPIYPGYPGFVVNAEYRFDPAVQRLMAERSLKALPLGDGQLYYVYPTNIDPRLEEMQIRYLEGLLEKRGSDEPE